MPLLKDIYERLLERGHKMTPQRWAILNIFLQNRGHHLSADEVYAQLKSMYPNNGIATVYRTIDLLVELDILKKLDFGDGRSRFEMTDPEDTHHHHHLICTHCGSVTEFQDDLMESVEAAIFRRTGFRIDDHIVKFYGMCRDCRERQERSPRHSPASSRPD